MRITSPRLVIPLRIRDFRMLWTGMTISLLGDGVFVVALAWEVYRLSNKASSLAYVGVASTVPRIALLLYGGILSDRIERRWLMIIADVVRFFAVGIAAILIQAGHLRLWHLFIVAGVASAGSALFMPAFGAIVPEIVPQDQLTEANSLDQFVRPATRLVGPALGGVVISVLGAGAGFALNAASFGCSALALAFVSPRPMNAREAKSFWDEIRGGVRAVRSQTWLWGGVLASIPMNLASGATFVLLPYIVKNKLHASASSLGLVYSVGAIGAIAAAVVIGQIGLPRRHIVAMYLGWTAGYGFSAFYAVAQHEWQLMLIAFAASAGSTVGQLIWGTLMHRLVPRDVLGRVYSVDLLTAFGLLPVSYIIVGLLADHFGVSTAIYVTSAWGGLSTLGFLALVPGMRDTETNGAIDAPTGPPASEVA